VEDLAHHERMIAERYAPLGALRMFQEGRRSSRAMAVASAWFTFIRTYILMLGVLDGFGGLCIAYFAAHNTFLKHAMLIEMRRSAEPAP
jgi:hypothetical protein